MSKENPKPMVQYAVIGFLMLMASGILVLAIFIPVNWDNRDCAQSPDKNANSDTIGRLTETSGVYKHAAVSADRKGC